MTKVDLNIALKSPFAKRYENYIGGEWRAPKAGKYFDNISPITGQPVCEIARSDASDIEAALDAAHAAKDAWGRTAVAERRRCSTRSPTASKRIWRRLRSPRRGTTASRSARRWLPTSR